MHNVQIMLQELHTVTQMLHQLTFHFSGKVVLISGNGTAKAYYVFRVVQYLFFPDWSAIFSMWLTSWYTCYSSLHSNILQCRSQLSFVGKICFRLKAAFT